MSRVERGRGRERDVSDKLPGHYGPVSIPVIVCQRRIAGRILIHFIYQHMSILSEFSALLRSVIQAIIYLADIIKCEIKFSFELFKGR